MRAAAVVTADLISSPTAAVDSIKKKSIAGGRPPPCVCVLAGVCGCDDEWRIHFITTPKKKGGRLSLPLLVCGWGSGTPLKFVWWPMVVGSDEITEQQQKWFGGWLVNGGSAAAAVFRLLVILVLQNQQSRQQGSQSVGPLLVLFCCCLLVLSAATIAFSACWKWGSGRRGKMSRCHQALHITKNHI
jgi:hypothetical protein